MRGLQLQTMGLYDFQGFVHKEMTSDKHDDNETNDTLFKDLPLIKFINNPTISNEMIKENVNSIYDIVIKNARKGDFAEPLISIYNFLFYYAILAIDPEKGFNMSKQNMIDLYNAYHKLLIKNIRESGDLSSSLA